MTQSSTESCMEALLDAREALKGAPEAAPLAVTEA
jgi:hypothetical protein